MLQTWTFQQGQSPILMTVHVLIIEECGMKPGNYVNMCYDNIWTQKKGPYSIITHINDLKELFPDEDFQMFCSDCLVYCVSILLSIYLDNCVCI